MPLSRRQKLAIGAVVIGTITVAVAWHASPIKTQKKKKRTRTTKTEKKKQESTTTNKSALKKENAEEQKQLLLHGPNLDSDSDRLAVRNALKEMLNSDPKAVLDGAWRLGLSYATDDPRRAAELFKRSADLGSAEGQTKLAACHFQGTGVLKDAHEAVRLYRLAAEQNHPKAQSSLGMCYLHGDGVAQDSKEAIRLLNSAARLGDLNALHNLAVFYQKGAHGVEQNTERAKKIFAVCAQQGLQQSRLALDQITAAE